MLLQHVSRHSNHNQVNYWTSTHEDTYGLCGPNRYRLLYTTSRQGTSSSASHCTLQREALVFVYCPTQKVSYAAIYMVTRLIAAGDTHANSSRKETTAVNVSMFICNETEKQIKQLFPRNVAKFVQPNTVHVFKNHFAEIYYFIYAYKPFNHNMLKKLQNTRSMGLKLSTETGGLMR